MFRRDAQIRPGAGTIVAEFANGTQAMHFARDHGYTVTAGINYPFAVRVPCEDFTESATSPSADSAPSAPQVPETEGGFFIRAMTPRGKEKLPELQKLLSRLPHTGDTL